MRFDKIELFRFELPLRAAFRTSTGELRLASHILIRAETAEGVVGWGESASEAEPNFGAETVETCWHVLSRFLVPRLLGHDWSHPEEAFRLLGGVRGNNFAKAALDIATWDCYAQSLGLALATCLGGTRDVIESGVSLGLQDTIPEAQDEAREIVSKGYRRVKLKIAPGISAELVEAVKAVVGETPIVVDANGGFRGDQTDELEALEAYELAMIEQPYAPDDLLLHRDLAQSLETPICLDESVPAPSQVALAIELRAADVINMKVSRLGGLTPALEAHKICLDANVPVWCGGMHEFGIGRAANIAVATLPGFTLPGDVSAPSERYSDDIVDPPITAVRGEIVVPTRPGLGFQVDEERIRAKASSATIFTAVGLDSVPLPTP